MELVVALLGIIAGLIGFIGRRVLVVIDKIPASFAKVDKDLSHVKTELLLFQQRCNHNHSKNDPVNVDSFFEG